MPDINTINFDLYAGNTEDCPWTSELFGSDPETRGELAPEDVVYCVLSTQTRDEPFTVVLQIQSDAETDNGSVVVILDPGDADLETPASGYVRFAQDDTQAIVDAWEATIGMTRYVCELFYTDSAEEDPNSAKKILARGIIRLHRSAPLS